MMRWSKNAPCTYPRAVYERLHALSVRSTSRHVDVARYCFGVYSDAWYTMYTISLPRTPCVLVLHDTSSRLVSPVATRRRRTRCATHPHHGPRLRRAIDRSTRSCVAPVPSRVARPRSTRRTIDAVDAVGARRARGEPVGVRTSRVVRRRCEEDARARTGGETVDRRGVASARQGRGRRREGSRALFASTDRSIDRSIDRGAGFGGGGGVDGDGRV